jgi:hypothetical protein
MRTYRKHAVAPVAPPAVITSWVGLSLAIDTEPFYRRIVAEGLGGFDPLLALTLVVPIPIEVHRMLVARSATLTVDETGVRYRAGVLACCRGARAPITGFPSRSSPRPPMSAASSAGRSATARSR